jgi:hypothetical protein
MVFFLTVFESDQVLMYMLYPSLLKNTFSGIECVKHKTVGNENDCIDQDRNNQLYFLRDQSIKCFDERHLTYIAALFAPALLLYVLLIPVIFFIQLKRNKKYIFAGPTPSRVVWGFITSGFEIDAYFWELVVLMRKAALIFVMVFVRPYGPEMTSLCCIVVLLGCLVAHGQFLPFEDYHIDLLEKSSLITNILMITLGLQFNYIEETTSIALMAFMFIINFIFFGTALAMYISSKIADKKKKKTLKIREKQRKDERIENEVHLNTRNSTKVSPTIQNRNTVPEKDITLTALKDWN